MNKVKIATVSVLTTLAVVPALLYALGKRPATGECTAPEVAASVLTYQVRAADGNCLHGYVWAPQGAAAKGVVVVVHGIQDHARRYEGLARSLNQAGLAVLAQDHRGHAASGGARQRIDSLDQVSADMRLAVEQAKQRYPGAPLFLYGHSMGGLVVTHITANYADPLAGVVISSAALQRPEGISDGKVGVVNALSALLPGLPLEPIDHSRVVRSPQAREQLKADPVLSPEKIPARTVATLLNGIDAVQSELGRVRAPLLVLHGTADQITPMQGSQRLEALAASPNKRLKLFPGALHDLLHEPEAETVRQDILAFVNRQLTAGQ